MATIPKPLETWQSVKSDGGHHHHGHEQGPIITNNSQQDRHCTGNGSGSGSGSGSKDSSGPISLFLLPFNGTCPKPVLQPTSSSHQDDHNNQTMIPIMIKKQDKKYHHHHDQKDLGVLGYKSEFQRDLNLWSTFGLSFSVLGLLPAFATIMSVGLSYGGTAGMMWGWWIAVTPIFCLALSIAELCSAMPTAGGFYYASALLAPEGYGPFAAWMTGWASWVGATIGPASVNYALASMIFAARSIIYPTWEANRLEIFSLTNLLLLANATLASIPTRYIGLLSNYAIALNLIGFMAVVILIPAQNTRIHQLDPSTGQKLSRYETSAKVWGTLHNRTDYPDAIAVIMSFLQAIWIVSGFDSPFHLAEECSNANIASPRAIVMTCGLAIILGYVLQALVAYTIIDIDSVLNSNVGQPWASYLLSILPRPTALALLSLTIGCSFFMGNSAMVSGSRITFSYARDNAFGHKLSHFLRRVNQTTRTPVIAVWFNTLLGCLTTFLIFLGPIAISAIFSIGTIAAYVAFTLPVALRVFACVNMNDNNINTNNKKKKNILTTTKINKRVFRPGPWNLGRFGKPIGGFAVIFVVIMIPIMCLPSKTASRLTLEEMNWTGPISGGWIILVLIWWILNAHRWFKGPDISKLLELSVLSLSSNTKKTSMAISATRSPSSPSSSESSPLESPSGSPLESPLESPLSLEEQVVEVEEVVVKEDRIRP